MIQDKTLSWDMQKYQCMTALFQIYLKEKINKK